MVDLEWGEAVEQGADEAYRLSVQGTAFEEMDAVRPEDVFEREQEEGGEWYTDSHALEDGVEDTWENDDDPGCAISAP
jgi:hypothetical protein